MHRRTNGKLNYHETPEKRRNPTLLGNDHSHHNGVEALAAAGDTSGTERGPGQSNIKYTVEDELVEEAERKCQKKIGGVCTVVRGEPK